MDKIKVVWICHLSNPMIRQNLKFCKWTPVAICKRLFGRSGYYDFAAWNTNGIREFEKFSDVELHIVAPHYGICGVQEFEKSGIYYHFFHTEDDSIISYFERIVIHKEIESYKKNTKIILSLVDKIKPDLVHLIGAENPYYSESALSIPKNIPLITTLQTLMIDPQFQKNYPISDEAYRYRSSVEKAVIKRSDYIGSKVEHFRAIIEKEIGEVNFLDINLAVGEDVHIEDCEKKYDFVYFAANISKAIDYALEAFAIAKRRHNDITLHVIGGYDSGLMNDIKRQMKRLSLGDGIDFTGKLPTYEDVIAEIKKARFALLPLKIDLISGTIRESMANGLPVVSTITPATPKLNDKRNCVLLSEKGDFEAMANNICRLLEEPDLVEELRKNSVVTLSEKYDNKNAMEAWRQSYYRIVENKGVGNVICD